MVDTKPREEVLKEGICFVLFFFFQRLFTCALRPSPFPLLGAWFLAGKVPEVSAGGLWKSTKALLLMVCTAVHRLLLRLARLDLLNQAYTFQLHF
ncbi:hypothetical protein CEXT_114561 [Caerostris extrusa]|uniref:Secreted protein n=1 Tax=Caerostris extrusa TaxID=172846 RepID=A0AAV4X4M7_CAEEX|nr:hypothetical protein CEXT_114561 [Caerostris extrusa]